MADEETPLYNLSPKSRERIGAEERIPKKVLLIPSLVTVVGIFCGFLAIIGAFKGQYAYAVGCIVVAIVLDGLDGRLARRLNATSAFGREFDSLSDVISFGIAPAVLVYTWAFALFADEFGLLISFLYVACGAARLARFNIVTPGEAKKHFDGLPIPGAAAALASAVYFAPTPVKSEWVTGAVLAYTLLLAGLMVSTFRFFSLKHLKLTRSNARLHLLLLSLAVALIWYNGRASFLLGAAAYALSGPMSWIWQRVWRPHSRPEARKTVGRVDN